MYVNYVSIKLEEKLYSVLSSSHLYARSAALVSSDHAFAVHSSFGFRESHSTSSFLIHSLSFEVSIICSSSSLLPHIAGRLQVIVFRFLYRLSFLWDFIHLYIICVLSPLESIFLIIKVYFSKMLRM